LEKILFVTLENIKLMSSMPFCKLLRELYVIGYIF
jgi:hypothetical protein